MERMDFWEAINLLTRFRIGLAQKPAGIISFMSCESLYGIYEMQKLEEFRKDGSLTSDRATSGMFVFTRDHRLIGRQRVKRIRHGLYGYLRDQ